MAELIRTAKSASNWTRNELQAYNISVVDTDVATFFGDPKLPALTTVDPIILNHRNRPAGIVLSNATRLFFHHLGSAMGQNGNQANEANVDDFALHLLRSFDYDGGNRAVHQQQPIRFMMCGEWVVAKPDICVLTEDSFHLLVQEDKVCSTV